MTIRSNAYALAFAAAWFAGAGFAQATEQVPPAAGPDDTAPLQRNAPKDPAIEKSEASSAAKPVLSEKKIDQFVNAYVAVQTIQQNAVADLQAAKDPAKIDAVKTKAETDMAAAVERTGLQVAEFNQIVQTMTADEDVRSQVAAKVHQRMGAPAQ